jgi:hypothetical protein
MARGTLKLAALAGLAKQAREYARKNPDSVSSTIARIESSVGRKVGPKYAAHVGKGGNAVRSGLGIPPGPGRTGVTPPPPSGSTPPPPPPVG